MIRSGVNKILFLLLSAIGLSFPSSSVYAQIKDSVPQGIIRVRRAPIPSEYHVRLNYSYDTKQRGPILHFFRPRQQAEGLYSPPDPVTLEQRNLNDSNQTMLDSSFIITFYNKQGKPAEEFAWNEYISQYEHTFEWDDTSGIDSTVFIYEVNTRGQVKCAALPTDDTSAIRLQKELLTAMKKLWVWYPAARVSDDGRKQKKTSCVVRVEIYAVKVGYGHNLPIKIVD
jgi:hypothetical protein